MDFTCEKSVLANIHILLTNVAVCKGRGYNFTFWRHVVGDCLIVL